MAGISDLKTPMANSITEMDYYAHRLHKRALHGPHDFSALHQGGRLLQECILDAHCKIEASRLNWQRFHQKELRAECYRGVLDALRNDDAANAGSRVILAPSFIGDPHEMHAVFQDSIAIVRTHSKPHLLKTFHHHNVQPMCTGRRSPKNILPGQQLSRAAPGPTRLGRAYFQNESRRTHRRSLRAWYLRDDNGLHWYA